MNLKFNFLKKFKFNYGFTLIELMTSVSVFAIVMIISMGTIITVLDANRKSQSLRSVMDNLNSTMESMTRAIRFGDNYHCGVSGMLNQPLDCSSGSSVLTIRDSSGEQITYMLSGGRLMQVLSGNVTYYLTSPDIVIQNVSFRVFGSYPNSGGTTNDSLQPQVIMVIGGYVGGKINTRSYFTLQTTISQRKFDYQ